MNPNHYVSLPLAKNLHEAGIEFPESEKAWLRIKQFGCDFSEWGLFSISYALSIEVCTGKTLVEHLQNSCTEAVEFIPAPSLSEILDRLPSHISIVRVGKSKWWCVELITDNTHEAPTAPDAAALMRLKLEKNDVWTQLL